MLIYWNSNVMNIISISLSFLSSGGLFACRVFLYKGELPCCAVRLNAVNCRGLRDDTWGGYFMNVRVRRYEPRDLPKMIEIWNEVVEEGIAFPQEEALHSETGAHFFAGQTYCAVAEDPAAHRVCGLYILHPNNVGRCGHICNASYAVSRDCRGAHIGEQLVCDSLAQGRNAGFRILQFNAVVATNVHARHLYERLGFHQLGVIPGGFRLKDGTYEDICPYYHIL